MSIKLLKAGSLAVFITLIWVGGSFFASAEPAHDETVAWAAKTHGAPQSTARVDIASLDLSPSLKMSRKSEKETTLPPLDQIFPIVFWFLGSALLAMIGYKRMRNDQTPMSDL